MSYCGSLKLQLSAKKLNISLFLAHYYIVFEIAITLFFIQTNKKNNENDSIDWELPKEITKIMQQ